jgi:membrane-associated phospholipid phosphatase
MAHALFAALAVAFGIAAAHTALAAPSDDWNAPYLLADAAPAQAGSSPPAASSYPRPESPLSVDYLKLIWSDAVETATEPAHWDGDDWRKAALIGGGLIFSMAVLDKPIRDAAQRSRSKSTDRFFTNIQKFGTKQYGLPVLLGFYGYGALADNNEAKAVALDGFSASVISALVTSSIKGVVGRARPYKGLGPHHFAPLQSDYSFPSGHATGAFAFASVIATHYDSAWVDVTAYGIAGLVGVARIEQDAHWTSDVVAGALIGGLIGHHLVDFNRRLREQNSTFAPTLSTDGQQLLLTWQF